MLGRTKLLDSEGYNNTPLHDRIYEFLKQNIILGRYLPGQKLALRGLANELGTSLIPVRDALKRLESTGGIVSSNANRTLMIPILSESEIYDLCQVRLLLETAVVDRVAMSPTKDGLFALEEGIEGYNIAARTVDIDRFLEVNYKFHFDLANMSSITFVTPMLEQLWLHVGPIVRKTVPDQEHLLQSVDHHKEIVEAIRARDVDRARAAISADIYAGF